MEERVFAICLAQLLFFPFGVAGGGCSAKWFGPDCRFKCHCQGDMQCATNGNCPKNNKCDKFFFGPGCQYLDLLQKMPSASTPLFVRDHNEETCSPKNAETTLRITLEIPFPFMWFRMVLNHNATMLSFSTQFNNKENCKSERQFIVNNTTVDVTCDTHDRLKDLEISGAVVRYICDLYISGGRNLALKQYTQQSSNCKGDLRQCVSDNAVDGNITPVYSSGHCSQTSGKEDGPEWRLTLLTPATLNFVCVHTTNKTSRQNDTVQTFTGNYKLTEFYTSSDYMLRCAARIGSISPVQKIHVNQSVKNVSRDRQLTICELEAYGETVCPVGLYGLSCEKKCACVETEVCHVHSGACSRGCKSGFYGLNCSYECSQHCLHRTCAFKTGNCLDCTSLYSDSICSDKVTEEIPAVYWLFTIPLILNIPILCYFFYWKSKRNEIAAVPIEEDEKLKSRGKEFDVSPSKGPSLSAI